MVNLKLYMADYCTFVIFSVSRHLSLQFDDVSQPFGHGMDHPVDTLIVQVIPPVEYKLLGHLIVKIRVFLYLILRG